MPRLSLLRFACWAVWVCGCQTALKGEQTDAGLGSDACVPSTCLVLAADCGDIPDGCGDVLRCGECEGHQHCGGGGTPNVCGCEPATCLSLGAECGDITDGCGGVLDCGRCASPLVCGTQHENRCGDPAAEPAPGCTHDAWCRQPVEAPVPRLLGLARGASGWLVGEGGAIWRLARVSEYSPGVSLGLAPFNSGTREVLRAVSGDDTQAWAVGDGVIVRWDGEAWTPTSVAATLNDVALSSLMQAWAVGDRVLHWDGRAWKESLIPRDQLLAVHADAPNSVWAVGERGGTLLHFDGTQWTRSAPLTGLPAERRYHSIIRDYEGLWLGGDDGVLAFLPTQASPVNGWRRVETGVAEAIVALGADWALTADGQVHARDRNGLAPSGVAGLPSVRAAAGSRRQGLVGVCAAPRCGASAGTNVLMNIPSANLRLGTPTSHRLNGIWSASETDAWAAGEAGTLLRWDGTAWRQVAANTASELLGIAGAAPDAVWTWAADGTLLRWDGTRWTRVPGPPGDNEYRLVVPRGADDLLVVTGREECCSSIFHFNGGAWTLLASHFGELVPRSLSPAGPREVWTVVGQKHSWAPRAPYLAHFDGSAWRIDPARTGLLAVHGFAADDVWATGQTGLALRWDGTTWRSSATGSFQSLDLLWGRAPDDVWAAGGAVALHWDGARWIGERTDIMARAIHGAGRAAWVVGERGGVARRLR